MINFKIVRFKNFLSTGNAFTEIRLDKSPTTLIVGRNGAGKTTILDALCFGLFDRAFRNISKTRLVNSINKKECVVELEFDVGSNQYKVTRGINPAVFEIRVNDTVLAQEGSTREQQQNFEDNTIRTNYKTFTQTVIVGTTNYIPFMKLPAGQRREIVEDLLDIKIFSIMSVLLFARKKENATNINTLEHQMLIVDNELDSNKLHLEKLEKIQNKEIVELWQKLNAVEESTISTKQILSEEAHHLVDLLDSIAQTKGSVEKLDEIKEIANSLRYSIDAATKEQRFFQEHESCPTCNQAIADKQEILDGLNQSLTDKRSGMRRLLPLLESAQKFATESQSLTKTRETLGFKMREHESHFRRLDDMGKDIQTKIEKLETTDNQSIITEVQNRVSELTGRLSVLKEQQEEHLQNRNLYDTATKLLKDDGIKSHIIKKYIPLFNQTVNKYLSDLGLNVLFELDEQFNEIVRSRGYDNFTYDNFSQGEKQRIDLALLLTWRDVAKARGSLDTSLVIFDETFDASMDKQGCDELLKLIAKSNENMNIFIVSHKGDMLVDHVKSVIEIEKQGNFSVIV